MRILEIAFHAFFEDTKLLVAAGVRNDIIQSLSDAESQEDRCAAAIRGKEREKNLKHWLKLKNPLAYGHMDKHKTYESLLQAIVRDTQDISHGLPHMLDHAMTPSSFVDLLLGMSRPLFPVNPYAPIINNGSFLPALKLAHKHLLTLSKTEQHPSQNAWISSMFLRAIKYLDISYAPSHLPRTSARGAPCKKAVYNSWTYLGLQDATLSQPLPPPSNAPSTSQRAAAVALRTALANDCNAEWTIQPLNLASIKSILNKATLPSDYATPSQSDAAYVNETFHWVKQAYNKTKPLHHLALIVSLMITCLRPQLFLPSDKSIRNHFINAHTPKQVHQIYNTLPWVMRRTKGMIDPTLLVSMFTTFIIAIYEPNSPLRQHMASADKAGLGDAWTNKYTMKSISYSTLIRMGILWGKGTGALEHGMFGHTWGCHPPKYIESMYKELISILQGKKDDTKGIFAPFDALAFLIGDSNARILCKSKGAVSSRPPSNPTLTGSKKGGQATGLGDDEEMDTQLDRIIDGL